MQIPHALFTAGVPGTLLPLVPQHRHDGRTADEVGLHNDVTRCPQSSSSLSQSPLTRTLLHTQLIDPSTMWYNISSPDTHLIHSILQESVWGYGTLLSRTRDVRTLSGTYPGAHGTSRRHTPRHFYHDHMTILDVFIHKL